MWIGRYPPCFLSSLQDLDVDPKEMNRETPEETGIYLLSSSLPQHCLYTRLSSLQKLRVRDVIMCWRMGLPSQGRMSAQTERDWYSSLWPAGDSQWPDASCLSVDRMLRSEIYVPIVLPFYVLDVEIFKSIKLHVLHEKSRYHQSHQDLPPGALNVCMKLHSMFFNSGARESLVWMEPL